MMNTTQQNFMTSHSIPPPFTDEMRNRQARGRDPYDSDSEDGDWGTAQPSGTGARPGTSGAGYNNVLGAAMPLRISAPKKDEPFATYERRRMAAQILDSPELLMMAALRDDESFPATRLKYTRMLCGLEEPNAPHPSTSTSARQSPDKQTDQTQPHQPQKRTSPGQRKRK
ncbi:hypothetical protein GGS21DRAFT_501756 [Xylaria nigripes]|nr:hypothetical protein GGS21DRAFT_501756 [Xylaria nigripes]